MDASYSFFKNKRAKSSFGAIEDPIVHQLIRNQQAGKEGRQMNSGDLQKTSPPLDFYYVDPVDQVKLFLCLQMAVCSLWRGTITDLSALRMSQIRLQA